MRQFELPKLKTVPCQELIPYDQYGSGSSGWKVPESGLTCVDPQDAKALINKYSGGRTFDDQASSVRIGFEICQIAS